MANGRVNVSPPVKAMLGYGLDSVAEIRPASSADGRWRAGVTWDNVCPDATSTYDLCVQNNALGTVTGSPEPKAATADRAFWGATPFTIFTEIDCSAPGFMDQANDNVRKAMDQASAYEVERVFWSGTVAGVPDLAFPHLIDNVGLVESGTPSVTLQLVSAPVVTGGPFDAVEALGVLEEALGTCVKGVATIHMPAILLPSFIANHLVETRDGVLYTRRGNKIAVSSAYTGESPAGVLTRATAWMYGTGPVFMYKSVGKFVGTLAQSLDRDDNTVKRIYERTYLIGYDCCLFGVPVTTEG